MCENENTFYARTEIGKNRKVIRCKSLPTYSQFGRVTFYFYV